VCSSDPVHLLAYIAHEIAKRGQKITAQLTPGGAHTITIRTFTFEAADPGATLHMTLPEHVIRSKSTKRIYAGV
jgi:hypothetical protein